MNFSSVPQYPIQISQDIIPPTLKQINGLSQQHSISPIRKSGDDLNIQKLPNKFDQLHSTLSSNPLKRDETISITKPEIEKLNAIIKIKTQQNQELQARISELELHYSLKQQDQESNHLYHQELAQTQIRSLQQEIIALQTQINQLSQSTLKFEQLLQQTQQENNSLREKLKNNTNNNELNVAKQEVISLNQQIIKANEVITSLEDQNKYYEQEYSKYIKENQNLQQKTDILTQQISNVKQEYDLIQEKLKQTEFKYSQQSKELEQTMEKLSKPQFESQNNNKMKQSQQQEIQQLTLQLTYKQQEIKTINDLNQQLKLQHEEQNQNLQNLQIVVERQNIQIGQLRKTIQLLEQNMQSSSQTDASYQQLLLNYNNLKEQLKNQSNSEIITLSNNQSLQHQLKLSQQQSQQQQTQIDKLKTMLKNRLDEIELWKTKCYQSETQAQITNQLITENEALREKFRQLEIEKGNQFASQEIQQLNQIINQQQEQLQLYKEKLFGNGNSNQIQEKQKKQMSSPKNSRYTLLEPNVKEFNSKKY